MKRIVILALSVACVSPFSSFAKDALKANPFTQTLAAVSAPELPAKSADLVKHAARPLQVATTKDVVRAAVGLNPAAAPSIVAAIARAVPQMAPVAAETAVLMQPDLASAIARAAAVAAPDEVSKIVLAVCKAMPSDYRNIASSVSRAVPGSNKEVLEAVAEAIPTLKPSIDSSLAVAESGLPPAGMALGQPPITGTPSTSLGYVSGVHPMGFGFGSLMPRGPVGNPPYLPISGNTGYLNSGDNNFQVSSGRTYASP